MEGAGTYGDDGDGVGCGEGSVVRWTNEDRFSKSYEANAECRVTRKVDFVEGGLKNQQRETRPANMGVLYVLHEDTSEDLLDVVTSDMDFAMNIKSS